MGNLPDFIIVGAMKCGTTALWRNLNQHPGITMGKNFDDPKKTSTEIRFFNNAGPYHTWRNGVDWYKNCFRGDFNGEKCANYIESKFTFQRMKSVVPNVKLILCVRNPVDRAYSEYFMQLHTNPRRKPPSFDHAIRKHKGYQERGKYYKMVKNNLLPFFSKCQLYVVVQERMKVDTVAEMNNLYDFLNLPHQSKEVVSLHFDKRDASVDKYRKWSSDYKQKMKPETFVWLKQFYQQHNERLFDFLGYRIDEWE